MLRLLEEKCLASDKPTYPAWKGGVITPDSPNLARVNIQSIQHQTENPVYKGGDINYDIKWKKNIYHGHITQS
jgi:hypothetical protein